MIITVIPAMYSVVIICLIQFVVNMLHRAVLLHPAAALLQMFNVEAYIVGIQYVSADKF